MFVPKSEIKQRLEKLQKIMQTKMIDGCLLYHHSDYYYYTGIGIVGVCWIPNNGNSHFFPQRTTSTSSDGKSLVKENFEYTTLHPDSRSHTINSTINEEGAPKKIGLAYDVISHAFYEKIKKQFPNSDFSNISFVIRQLRAIKSDYEIIQMKKAGQIAVEVMEKAHEIIKEGMTELELAIHLDTFLRTERGHPNTIPIRSLGTSFPSLTSVISGKSISSSLKSNFTVYAGNGISHFYPYGPSTRKFTKNQPISIDLASFHNGYLSDCTRIFVIGKLPPELIDDLTIAKDILKYCEKNIKDGKKISEIYAEIIEYTNKSQVTHRFMGLDNSQTKFIGHGLGIQLDELPVITENNPNNFQQGNVVAIEPKIIDQQHGGIGKENTYYISKNGTENLTPAKDYL